MPRGYRIDLNEAGPMAISAAAVTSRHPTPIRRDERLAIAPPIGWVLVRQRVDTKLYWWLGHVIDLVHMPIVIVLVLWGAARFSGELYVSIVVVTVILQIGLMGCPVMALTGRLKRLHDPSYINHWSFTVWLYRKHGPIAGVTVFLFFVGVGVTLRALFFS